MIGIQQNGKLTQFSLGGGVLDDAPSLQSDRGVKNKAIAAEAKRLEELIAQNRRIIQQNEEMIRFLQGQKATESVFGLAKISESTTVTENNGLVLSAKEKNASVPGSIASGVESVRRSVEDLDKRIINNSSIHDIAEIFDYRMYDLALFSNWNNSPIAPKNYSMILRIPNLDARNAKCICLSHDNSLFVGQLVFGDRTIQWTEK